MDDQRWHDVWRDLVSPRAADRHGSPVEITGFAVPLRSGEASTQYFALTAEPPCCIGCLPRAPDRRIEVFTPAPIRASGQRIRLRGEFRVIDDDAGGWRYQLREARAVQEAGFTRRHLLAAAPLLCAAVSLPRGAMAAAVGEAMARGAIAGRTTVDMHSHAGRIAGQAFVKGTRAADPVAAPMRTGGMAVACLAVVADGPTHRVMDDHRIHPYRTPAPGELYDYTNQGFARLHQLIQDQGLTIIRDAAQIRVARAEQPSVVVATEGADFLEGQIGRLDEAYNRWSLRHLQLVHYRVNELGDIQTEPPEHGGLTDFGAAVIQRCNSLGIVVDVAHGTFDLVTRAARVTTKPLILSHTSLTERLQPFTRTIDVAHARLIAGTGGVVGIWPPAGRFPDKAALAAGMARMVDAIGIDHVGLGSDMNGLVGASTFAGYDETPALVAALLAQGFSPEDMRKLMGGNYVRVFTQTVR
jgi:membrane dipeptidase